jgi:hypothetical protein
MLKSVLPIRIFFCAAPAPGKNFDADPEAKVNETVGVYFLLILFDINFKKSTS